ncbi:Cathepsin Z [Hondaea fermentalgiana]|uniref:Cathepsin Z n=1 Tax=Hondaea fermentalgiana TaxID=2315210 RepID=A0A2R5GGI8_9STRA|nr:Cathepsin Z [Hondaea fermentalgiana]|eukprot:GBG29990.1 Cathepsin Z [Hondaea fermentalgiana]
MVRIVALVALVAALVAGAEAKDRRPSEFVLLPGHTKREWKTHEHAHEYLDSKKLPKNWDWRNVNGVSYVTKSLNQHIPQYCGSCWAHGAASALADRIKIARKAQGDDVNLAVQYILNCGTTVAGSCHGGSHTGAYQFIKESGYIPYDTCMNYAACSAESEEGDCKSGDYTCKPINICRTCSTFKAFGGFCSEIDVFPNATVAEYGTLPDAEAVKREIYARGPVACGVNANELSEYQGGILDLPDASREIDHIVSTVGWGTDDETGREYWIVRNSWGVYWGMSGFYKIYLGDNQLGMDTNCAWATPGHFTEENEVKCFEDGTNCVKRTRYVDSHEMGIPYGELLMRERGGFNAELV